jgi:hypothetical protein
MELVARSNYEVQILRNLQITHHVAGGIISNGFLGHEGDSSQLPHVKSYSIIIKFVNREIDRLDTVRANAPQRTRWA